MAWEKSRKGILGRDNDWAAPDQGGSLCSHEKDSCESFPRVRIDCQ